MNDHDLLVKLAEQHTALKPVSGKLLGLCPIHDEKTPSFWIYPDGKFSCFGCTPSGGDAIDLYQAIHKTDFETAKRALGLWNDNGRPQVKRRKWPTCYKTADKEKAYRGAVASIQAGKDMKINYDGIEYLNYQFIARCLEGVENYRHYIVLISMKIEDEIRKVVFLNNIIDIILEEYETR